MIDQTTEFIESGRDAGSMQWKGEPHGAFVLPFLPHRAPVQSPKPTLQGLPPIIRKPSRLRIVASPPDEMGAFQMNLSGPVWEHVSVSVVGEGRTPTWEEMCFVKRLFWKPTETVLQFHPAEAAYINRFDYVLHLWRLPNTDHVLPNPAYV